LQYPKFDFINCKSIYYFEALLQFATASKGSTAPRLKIIVTETAALLEKHYKISLNDFHVEGQKIIAAQALVCSNKMVKIRTLN